MMHSHCAELVVGAEPGEAYSATLRLIGRLWPTGPDQIVDAQRPKRLVHSVLDSGEIACWMTWTFEQVEHRKTRVVLTHDELGSPTAPPPQLDDVLRMLAERIAAKAR
jgi:hypothetical protein